MKAKNKRADIFFIIFCMATASVFAAYRCLNGDFVAYNGDFQNYNIFRRIMEGQIPYTDFTNYLGNGMIWINYPLIVLFRSFGCSVFITNFTASIMYSLVLLVSFYVVTQNRKRAYVLTSIISILAFLVLHSGLNNQFYYKYLYNFFFFEELGHSMRTTRAALPFLFVGIFVICKHLCGKKKLIYYILGSDCLLACAYFIFGVFTVWSNDYGYSSVLCLFAISVLIYLLQEQFPLRDRVKKYIISIGSTVAGMIIIILIITRGHIDAYFSVTRGIADYQLWYYGNVYGKFLTLSDLFVDKKYVVLTIIFWFHACFFLVQCVRKEAGDMAICQLYLHSTCYVASVVYAVGSGAHNYAALEIITYIFAGNVLCRQSCKTIIYIYRFLEKKSIVHKKWADERLRRIWSKGIEKYKRNRLQVWVLGMLLFYCISAGIIRTNISYSGRVELKEMGVSSVIGTGVDEIAEKLAGKDVFSTYASAIETTNRTFQPSGTDYIIHVLGDDSRNQYLQDFIENQYVYATTLKNDYTVWEYWASRANWFFYRELYANYEPVDETLFSVVWRKTDKKKTIDTKVEMSWKYLDETTCRIDIELPKYKDKAAYVDLSISYATLWSKERLSSGALHKVVCVQDGGEQYNSYQANSCYYLPERADNCSIPVYVKNGKGYVYLSSNPSVCTRLEEVNPTVNKVIEEPDYPLHTTAYTDINPALAQDGVNAEGNILKFDLTEPHRTILENAGELKAGNQTGIVENVWIDGNYIYVSLQNQVDRKIYEYPNEIKVIRRDKTYTVQNYSDDEWICGISRKEGCVLIAPDIDIENLYGIKAGNTLKKITKIEKQKQGYCLHMIDNYGIQIFAYPQPIELVYRQHEKH